MKGEQYWKIGRVDALRLVFGRRGAYNCAQKWCLFSVKILQMRIMVWAPLLDELAVAPVAGKRLHLEVSL
jgi:hypothetical protein